MLHFELCAQTIEACVAARDGGAHRIELCRALQVGGLTPEVTLVAEAVRQSGLPVHVLLRPHADHFRADTATVTAISTSLEDVRRAGAAGVVLGFLKADATVDVASTRALVRQAAPLPVTFHRAFDETPDLQQALEDVIAAGCTRLLTSGGVPDVQTGAAALARLVRQAAGRIDIALGGGLRLDNAVTVAQSTAAEHFHGSLRHLGQHGHLVDPSAAQVREMIARLQRGYATATPPQAE